MSAAELRRAADALEAERVAFTPEMADRLADLLQNEANAWDGSVERPDMLPAYNTARGRLLTALANLINEPPTRYSGTAGSKVDATLGGGES